MELQQMERYIGTKIIHACPMTREDAEKHLGRNVGGTKTGDGYLVEYDTGYQAWSPADAFDAAYRRTNEMSFGLAVEAAKKGLKVARKGWNGKGMYLQYQFPDEHSKMSFPYLYLTIQDGAQDCEEGERRLPWQPAQVDIWKDDWYIVE